jgi:hypothetical protein
MKQGMDTKTHEIPAFPIPPRRGRPPTGKALSAAERSARRRSRLELEKAAMFAEIERLKQENSRLRALCAKQAQALSVT